ncbi:hypothetical protein Ple7327_3815 [Pleurocapsa sp. PCC 7327]|nr:hypothetical protein Ple7327_3815 [Pleurocapsa sp. PCC 7327]
MPEEYPTERTITAVFKQESQINDVIKRLLDRGVSRDHISVMGRNFQSQTRITGFITKKDVILSGLKNGAIFGSLFGSFLSLLTGVGVLFIPFVGSVVAAGPISSILLGAASGAIAGSAGAGLASALATLGMPQDKAAIYETRLKAGDFIVIVEVPADKSGEFQLLLESAGGEEIHTTNAPLSRVCRGRCGAAQKTYRPKFAPISHQLLRKSLSSATTPFVMRPMTKSRQSMPLGTRFAKNMRKTKTAFGLRLK